MRDAHSLCAFGRTLLGAQSRHPGQGHFRFARTTSEQDGNELKGFEDFCLKNGSSRSQNLALTVSFVPNSLDSGMAKEDKVRGRKSKVGHECVYITSSPARLLPFSASYA